MFAAGVEYPTVYMAAAPAVMQSPLKMYHRLWYPVRPMTAPQVRMVAT